VGRCRTTQFAPVRRGRMPVADDLHRVLRVDETSLTERSLSPFIDVMLIPRIHPSHSLLQP